MKASVKQQDAEFNFGLSPEWVQQIIRKHNPRSGQCRRCTTPVWKVAGKLFTFEGEAHRCGAENV